MEIQIFCKKFKIQVSLLLLVGSLKICQFYFKMIAELMEHAF